MHDKTHEDSHNHPAHDASSLDEGGRTPNEFELLERALRELLIEKGVFSAEDVRRAMDAADSRTPADGARVVE